MKQAAALPCILRLLPSGSNSLKTSLIPFYLICGVTQSALIAQTVTVPAGTDITSYVNSNTQYKIFELQPGQYTCSQGACVTRNSITIRPKTANTTVEMTEPMQICGNNNLIEGLTWYGDNGNNRSNDPGTLALSGQSDTVRGCQFLNFQSSSASSVIIYVGRQKKSPGCFTFTMASNCTIDSCLFDKWGFLSSTATTEASGCIKVGKPNTSCDGNCTGGQNCPTALSGTVIRNNTFTNGPYKNYGYNSAIAVYDPVTNTLIENNTIDHAHEVLEMKASNIIVRGNRITNVSGYNVLANRIGQNNLFEKNYIENVDPIPGNTSQGFMVWTGGNTVYRNNIFHNCTYLGLIIGKQNAGDATMDYVLFINNTCVGFPNGIRYESGGVTTPDGYPTHVDFINNIFYGADGVSAFNLLTNFQAQSLGSVSNNLFYNHVNSTGTSPVTTNPKFANVASADFHLLSGSSAIDAGMNWTAGPGMPSDDFDSAKRPVMGSNGSGGALYDIGAFEYQGTATGINDPEANSNVIVYPNPSNGSFSVGMVGMSDQPKELRIYDAMGKKISDKIFENGNLKVFSGLEIKQPGIYIITILTDKQVLSRRITIVK